MRPGLLLNKSRPNRFIEDAKVTCTGGSVTGGAFHAESSIAQGKRLRCPSVAKGPVEPHGNGIKQTARVVWNAADKAGHSNLKLNFLFTSDTGGTISGTVLNGPIAATHPITGTFTIGSSLKSIPNGGRCSTTKPMDDTALSAIAFATN